MMETNDVEDDYGEEIEVIESDGEEEDMVEIEDSSKLTFAKHGKSVFTGALSSDGSLAVTGGEDDMAYVWSTQTSDVLFECTGHTDSISEVAFSFNDKYVATGDMSGVIQVWNVEDKKLEWSTDGDDLEWLLWHHMSNVLFIGSHSGCVYVWQLPQAVCKVLSYSGAPSTCGKLLSDGKRLLVGYENGEIRLWDIKTENVLWHVSEIISTKGITSMDVTEDSNLFIVAPSALLFKVSNGQKIFQFLSPNEEEVEVVAFNKSGLLATGAISGKACIWDFKRNSLRYEESIESAITSLKWSLNDRVFFGSTDCQIYHCDAKNGKLINTLGGHLGDILSLTISKDNSFILSTSDDGTAKLFTTALV